MDDTSTRLLPAGRNGIISVKPFDHCVEGLSYCSRALRFETAAEDSGANICKTGDKRAMVIIDSKKCIGCGKCVADCVSGRLELKEGQVVYRKRCIKCGHCVAICPVNAVSMPQYDMGDVEEYEKESFHVEPSNLLRAIKFRRSVRDFQQASVESDKLKDVVNAGRCSPTASNRQDFHFVVIQEQLPEFKKLIWSTLEKQLEAQTNMPRDMIRPFSRFYDMRRKDPNHDYLFRNATVAIIMECGAELDAGIAAQNMELTASAHGLGVLYDQYLSYAITTNRAALDWLRISATHQKFILSMLLGYPKVSYKRTAPRKHMNITWR